MMPRTVCQTMAKLSFCDFLECHSVLQHCSKQPMSLERQCRSIASQAAISSRNTTDRKVGDKIYNGDEPEQTLCVRCESPRLLLDVRA